MLGTRTRILALALLLLSAATSGVRAQDGPALVREALQRYTESASGIDNYRIVSEVMGIETELVMVKEVVGDQPVFVPFEQSRDDHEAWRSPYNAFRDVADRARYVGDEEVDGHGCRVVEVDDFEGVDFGSSFGGDQEFIPEYMSLCLDDDLLLRRMVFRGTLGTDGEPQPVSFSAVFSDYRNVEGMHHPFTTSIVAEGMLEGNTNISEEDLAKAREAMRELEAQMSEMGETERSMMERVMGPQLKRLQEMVESGQLKTQIVVKSIEVNVPIEQ